MFNEETTLYRMFDSDGLLLYIGITNDIGSRIKNHSLEKCWFNQIANINIVRFRIRDRALKAEEIAIKKENPIYNVAHNCPSSGLPRTGSHKPIRSSLGDITLRLDGRAEAVLNHIIISSNRRPIDAINDILMMFLHNQELYGQTKRDSSLNNGRPTKLISLPANTATRGKIDYIKRSSSVSVSDTVAVLLLMYKQNGYKVPKSEIVQPERK